MQYKNSDYEIYEDGRCYSYKSNKFLKPQITNKYPTYNLSLPDGKRKVYIHRMVAETFLPKIDGKNIVNHKDGNTKNFHVNNLEWVNHSENTQHAVAIGLLPKGNQNAIYYNKDLENEKWIDSKDFPNYRVSSCGRVMNKNTKRLLKPTINSGGYYEVSLWKNNRGTTKQIHALVYSSFYPEQDITNLVINHIDGNKKNNELKNLELITYQENNLHAEYIIQTHKCSKPVIQKDINNNVIHIYNSIAEATRKTGIGNISRAIKTSRCAGGYKWEFYNNN